MDYEKESGRVDRIQDLIRREKEEAERSFEEALFDTRLFGRIRKAEAGRPLSRPAFLLKPWPAAAFSTLVLAIAALLLSRALSPSPFQLTIRAMGSVLSEAGGRWRTGEQSAFVQRGFTLEYTDFGWGLKGVLTACERQSLEHIDLMESLSRVILEGKNRPAAGRGEEKTPYPDVESLQLKTAEDYRVFFARFLRKFEEV